MASFKNILTLLASLPCLLKASPVDETLPFRPQALVYRGNASCDGCSEAVARLLQSSPRNFQVQYAGPDEEIQISAESLNRVVLFAQPDGGGENIVYDRNQPSTDDFAEVEKYTVPIRNFVSKGGRYLGFNLGARFAQEFGILPENVTTPREALQDGAEAEDEEFWGAVQVDWISVGKDLDNTTLDTPVSQITSQRIYFEDGVMIKGLVPSENATILGRYSSNQDVAASVTKFGAGWVGLTGPRPEVSLAEADEVDMDLEDGTQYDIGYDLIDATMFGAYEWCQSTWCPAHSKGSLD